ncbi:unnamed protein product [Sympodiomycopsis kandeliae]
MATTSQPNGPHIANYTPKYLGCSSGRAPPNKRGPVEEVEEEEEDDLGADAGDKPARCPFRLKVKRDPSDQTAKLTVECVQKKRRSPRAQRNKESQVQVQVTRHERIQPTSSYLRSLLQGDDHSVTSIMINDNLFDISNECNESMLSPINRNRGEEQF